MSPTLADQIKAQQGKVRQAEKELKALQAKVRAAETKRFERFERFAKKVGFYDVPISDEQLESALKQLVKAARLRQSESIV